MFTGPPDTQTPSLHTSGFVHALPSVQGAVLLVCTQPVAELQLSSVQTLLSSQLGGDPPTHAPLEHVSFVVQALLSSQEPSRSTNPQPVNGSHAAA